jgi:hypothetical protein
MNVKHEPRAGPAERGCSSWGTCLKREGEAVGLSARATHTTALLLMLGGAAVGIVGFFGWAATGMCDSDCPSDSAHAAYKAMAWAGPAALAMPCPRQRRTQV